MSDERAHTVNTLRDIAQALQSDQQAQAVEILGAVGPEAEHGRPSATQLTAVALASLDSWYAANGLQNGAVRVVQRDVPRSIRDLTPAVEALASKGRALRSAESLLQRNPQQAVAGASAYMVAATLNALAQRRDTEFDAVLDELLPAQEVSEPVAAPAAKPAAADTPKPAAQTPEAAAKVVDVVDETVEEKAAADTPADRYTAIVETRFMAGIKEFFQWMGEGHAVTGTGLPKRADIADVAATIGISAEGVAKNPEPGEPVASDLDLKLAAEPQPARSVTSAQAIPELMALWATLQETSLVELTSTKIQPGSKAVEFGFEDTTLVDAAENLVETYVYQTLTVDVEPEAAAQTAALLTGASQDVDGVVIPRLRQLEAMGLLDIDHGSVVIAPALAPAVLAGAQRVTK